MTEMVSTYWPTVLVVDDDPAATDYWKERFHGYTSVGVVVANDLAQGRELIDNPDVEFDAILADIHFDYNRNDPNRNLRDGLDLLAYSQHKRPDVLRYTLSFFAEHDVHHRRADELQITVKQWIPKAYYRGDFPYAPWTQVERDLIVASCGRVSDPHRTGEKNTAADPELAWAEYARRLKIPVRTYLQSIGANYVIVKPIEVVCERHVGEGQDSAFVTAEARRLGLLAHGEGKSVDEAMSDLSSIIYDQIEFFRATEPASIVGYAEFVRNRLLEHISVADTKG